MISPHISPPAQRPKTEGSRHGVANGVKYEMPPTTDQGFLHMGGGVAPAHPHALGREHGSGREVGSGSSLLEGDLMNLYEEVVAKAEGDLLNGREVGFDGMGLTPEIDMSADQVAASFVLPWRGDGENSPVKMQQPPMHRDVSGEYSLLQKR